MTVSLYGMICNAKRLINPRSGAAILRELDALLAALMQLQRAMANDDAGVAALRAFLAGNYYAAVATIEDAQTFARSRRNPAAAQGRYYAFCLGEFSRALTEVKVRAAFGDKEAAEVLQEFFAVYVIEHEYIDRLAKTASAVGA